MVGYCCCCSLVACCAGCSRGLAGGLLRAHIADGTTSHALLRCAALRSLRSARAQTTGSTRATMTVISSFLPPFFHKMLLSFANSAKGESIILSKESRCANRPTAAATPVKGDTGPSMRGRADSDTEVTLKGWGLSPVMALTVTAAAARSFVTASAASAAAAVLRSKDAASYSLRSYLALASSSTMLSSGTLLTKPSVARRLMSPTCKGTDNKSASKGDSN